MTVTKTIETLESKMQYIVCNASFWLKLAAPHRRRLEEEAAGQSN